MSRRTEKLPNGKIRQVNRKLPRVEFPYDYQCPDCEGLMLVVNGRTFVLHEVKCRFRRVIQSGNVNIGNAA